MKIRYTDQQAVYLAEVASGKTLELVAKDNNVSKETVSYQLRGLKEAVGASTLPNLVARGINNKIIVERDGGYVTFTQNRTLIELGQLERKPGVQNWIERLPAGLRTRWNKSIIYRAAVHMVNEKGMNVGHAIASAINWAKHICETGDVKQWRGPQQVKPKSQAECCAAIALWSEMKAASKANNS